MDLSCYDNIIGLSQTECECFEAPPEDYNTSESGLYLDQLTPLNNIKGLEDCSTSSDMWVLMANARDEAIKTFVSDTNALLSKHYAVKRKSYKGAIGRDKHKGLIENPQYTYLGMRIRAANILSGILVIKGIGTIFENTGTVTVFIYDNTNTLLHTKILDTQAGKHQENTFDVPIELPLFIKYQNEAEYFIIFQYSALNKPYSNDLHCSSCGKSSLTFNTYAPYYHKRHVEFGWANWIMAGSYKTDSLVSFDDCDSVTSNELNGLTLDVELRCNVSETLCKDELDFEGNPLALAMAYAIRFKAAEILADAMIKSGKLNRYTLIDHEFFGASIEEWREQYKANVEYLASNANIASNDCFICKDNTGLKNKGLLS